MAGIEVRGDEKRGGVGWEEEEGRTGRREDLGTQLDKDFQVTAVVSTSSGACRVRARQSLPLCKKVAKAARKQRERSA